MEIADFGGSFEKRMLAVPMGHLLIMYINNFVYAEKHWTKDRYYGASGELPYETTIVVDLDNMVPVDFTPYNWFHGFKGIEEYGEYGATEYPRVVEPKIFFTN